MLGVAVVLVLVAIIQSLAKVHHRGVSRGVCGAVGLWHCVQRSAGRGVVGSVVGRRVVAHAAGVAAVFRDGVAVLRRRFQCLCRRRCPTMLLLLLLMLLLLLLLL